MSNDQQPDEQKAPTFWHVLGIGAVGGAMVSYIAWVIIGWDWNPEIGQDWFMCFSRMPSMIGAGIGVLLPKTSSKKWRGLWIGTVLGPFVLFFIIYLNQLFF